MANVDIRQGYKNTAWFTANPTLVLEAGQVVHLEQTGTYKIGDGSTQLSALSFKGGSGGGTWGSITGTLSAQTDLQTALNLKANSADLFSANPIISGVWRGPMAVGSFSTSTWFTGQAYFMPYVVEKKHTVTKIRLHIATGVAASSIRLALYSRTGNVANVVLDQSGAIPTTASGIYEYTFSVPIELTEPLYWMSCQFSSASISARYYNTGIAPMFTRTAATPFSAFYIGSAYGSFPSPANMAGATYLTGGNILMLELLP